MVASSGPLFTLEVQFRWVPLPVISLCLSCSPWPRMAWVPFPHPRPAKTPEIKGSVHLSVLQIICLESLPVLISPSQSGFSEISPHPFILD